MVFSIFELLSWNLKSFNSNESDLAWHLNKHWHAMHPRVVIFLDEWVEMGHYVTDVWIFVREKEHLLSRDFHENIIEQKETF